MRVARFPLQHCREFGGVKMCPLREQCTFLHKFARIRHEKLQNMIKHYCAQDDGHKKCIHYMTNSLFDMKLDSHVCPTGNIIPRPRNS